MERLLLTLTPSESKRLIGKAIANLPEVKKAYKEATVFIATSTTTAYVAEELLNKTVEDKGFFTAGVVVPRGLCLTSGKRRHRYIGIRKGVAEEATLSELREKWLPEMGPDDVFVKGANAIDHTGAAGILLGNPQGTGTGGTITTAIGTLTTRGVQLIIAAGLEKLVPCSLTDVAPTVGGRFKYAAGFPSGMIVVKGKLMIEIQAFKTLTETTAVPIAAGGISKAEGSHTFIVEGTADNVEKAWTLFKTIKGEPALTTVTESCDECERGCHFNIDADLKELRRTNKDLGGY